MTGSPPGAASHRRLGRPPRAGYFRSYVTFDVSPYLAADTQATTKEARRLHKALGRENVLIKVPATPEGIPVIQTLISEGISVNVTLLFSLEAYEKVANAYMTGLEQYA